MPVHHDTPACSRLLPLLLEQPAVAEIIVSASAVTDALRATCDHECVRLIAEGQGRGRQLNAGAAAAKGDALWFVHADATPPFCGARFARDRVAAGDTGGWFRFRFEGINTPGTRRLERLINWRARHGVAYGDQGLFFRREFFMQHGGFAAAPLFEEVALVKAAKATGRFDEAHLAIGVDPRRWQQTGWSRRTLTNRALALAHGAGVSPETLARWYRRF